VGSFTGSWVNTPTQNVTGALTGDSDKAVTMDGTDDHGTVADADALDMSSGVSIEAWVKRTESGTFQAIVGKPLHGTNANENYSLWIDTANKIKGYVGDGTSSESASVAIDTGWHHVVFTYDEDMLRLYVDGTQAASKASSIQLTPNSSSLWLGRSSNSSSTAFGGSVDEVAIYPTVLSAAQVQAHYNAGQGVAPAPPTR
jgi:hypothetical protein